MESRVLAETGLQTVARYFSRGLSHFLALIDSLPPSTLHVRSSDVTEILDKVQHHAENVFINMKYASEYAEDLNKNMMDQLHMLICKIGELEKFAEKAQTEIRQNKDDKIRMNIGLKEMEKNKREAESQYKRAFRSFRSCKRELDEAKGFQKGVEIAGYSLLAVPFAGWVASAGLLFVAYTALEDKVNSTRKDRDTALQYKKTMADRVQSKKRDIKELEDRIYRAEKKDEFARMELNSLIVKKQMMEDEYVAQAEICTKLKKCISYVGAAAERSKILRSLSITFSDPSSISIPIQELASLFSLSDASKLSHCNLTAFAEKLKRLCAAEDCFRSGSLPIQHKDCQIVMLTKSGETAMRATEMIGNLTRNLKMEIAKGRACSVAICESLENYLCPAVLIVNQLGQQVLLSSIKDFPLDAHPPKDGYQYMKWPKSFRASLAQVTEAGFEAFQTAQRSMDTIRIHASLLPEHLNDILRTLQTATTDEISNRITKLLNEVKHASDICVHEAKKIETANRAMINLVEELLEALTGAKSQSEKQRDKIKSEVEALREEEKKTKEKESLFQEQQQKMIEALTDARKMLRKALKEKPGTDETFVMFTVDAILAGVRKTLGTLSNPVRSARKAFSAGSDNETSASITPNQGDSKELDDNVIKVYSHVDALQRQVDILVDRYLGNDSLKNISYENRKQIHLCSSFVKQIIEWLGMTQDCTVKEEALTLCKTCLSVCEELENRMEAMITSTRNKKSEKELARKLMSYQKKVQDFAALGADYARQNTEKSPNQRRLIKPPGLQKGAVKYEFERLQMFVELAKDDLEQKQAENDRISKEIEQVNRRLADILDTVKQLDFDSVEFDKIIDLLSKGLTELAHFKMQWNHLISFFQKISDLITCSMSVNLDKIRGYSEPIIESQEYDMIQFQTDLLYKPIDNACELADYVAHVTKTYTEISQKWLLPSIRELPILLATPKSLIAGKMEHLNERCKQAQSNIEQLVRENVQAFEKSAALRMSYIKETMEKTLPEIDQTISEIDEIDCRELV